MSEEQNARINEAFRIKGHGREILTNDDIDWLISELEQCRAENKELWAVFNLQATRTKKAEKMWQEATGNPGTLPDLGVLLEWLMKSLENQLTKGEE